MLHIGSQTLATLGSATAMSSSGTGGENGTGTGIGGTIMSTFGGPTSGPTGSTKKGGGGW